MRRRRVALSLAILWIVGFELLPWAHIALHDHLAPHHHDAYGADVVEGHEQDDDDLDREVDEHGVPVSLSEGVGDGHPFHSPMSDADARLAAALAHGAHSLAHHGIAVPVPAPAITMPLPVDRRPITLATVAELRPASQPVPEAAARGPPGLWA